MGLPGKRWAIKPECPAEHLASFAHLDPLLVQILYNRGITTPQDVASFLSGILRYQPLAMQGMGEAVERIRHAIQRGQSIAVYGDFDADGVTATALLVQTLRAFGVRVTPYIPDRVDEGYGLNCHALENKIKPWGADLVITVDCGIRSVEEVAFGRRLGMDMIVTDHHDIGPEVPPALAVLNPKQKACRYPFKGLSGVGVAFKLAEALFDEEERSPVAASGLGLSRDDLLDLVALGTVADIVPLLGENRSLVKRGLERLRRAQRPGIQAMLVEARLAPEHVNAYSIGFILGPRLNAAGRLESAGISYRILTTRDAAGAAGLASQLGELNRRRQRETQALVGRVREEIARQGSDRYLYLVAGTDYLRGIVGLAAGRLAEELYRPVLVAERNAEAVHGSARSIPEFDITAALDRCKADDGGLLIRYGGHAMAAGFTAPLARLAELQDRLEALAAEQLRNQILQPALEIDARVALSDLDYARQQKLAELEPCGSMNAQPVLCSLDLEVLECRLVGQEGQHLKLTVRDANERGPSYLQTWEAIAFRQADWYAELSRLPKHIDLAYTFEVNQFNGERRLQLNVKDIRATVVD